MPNLPLLEAPGNVQSAQLSGGARPALLRPSTVSPTLTTATRADPNMFAGIAAAGRQIGAGVEEFGDIAARIKNAQDSAFITRAQTAMEGASLEFQAWTKTNPDPATWGAELDERIGAVKENMGDGATALSPMAQQRLKLVTDQWQTRTTRGVQLQATEQSLSNAQADSNEYIALATSQNDLPGIQAKLDEGVKSGIYRPVVAQHILQKSRTQILTNTVNGMIDNDPFTTEKVLGDDSSFPGMNATLKETLKFRAHKAAEQTRTESMRDMAQGVYAMQGGTGPDVDKDEMLVRAEHEGISPKYVEKLFKPAKTFDADGMAKAKVDISGYDPAADEQHGFTGAAKLTQQIYELNLPPQTTTELLGELKKKSDPKDPINSPTAKGGNTVIAQRFALMEKQAATQVYAPEKGMAGTPGHIPAHWKATTNQAAVDSAMKLRAEVQTAFNQYVEANPKATPADAEQFIHDAFKTRGGGAGAAVFGGKPVNPQTGGVPRGTATPTIEPTATNAKGEKLVYRNGAWIPLK